MKLLHPLCVAFLHREEGLKLATYDDRDGAALRWDGNAWRRPDGGMCLGFPTIGRGRKLLPDEIIQTCTLEQADLWFLRRVSTVDLPEVDRVWPDANDFQRGALCDYSYNAGSQAITIDKFREAWDQGGPDALRAKWLTSRTTGAHSREPLAVLVGRRAREWALFCHTEPLTLAEVEDVLRGVRVIGAQIAADLPSLQGVILSEDESPH